jgi:hypothetical protein
MTLVTHSGAKRVSLAEVLAVAVPAATRTWSPVGHGEVINTVSEQLPEFGLSVVNWEHALRRDGGQYFGVISVEGTDGMYEIPGVQLQIGVRNSINKSLAAGLVAGNKVFVCDNLAFSGEVALSRKHTSGIRHDLVDKTRAAFGKLLDLFGRQKKEIESFQATALPDGDRDRLITMALRSGVLPPSRFDKLEKQWKSTDPDSCGGVTDSTVWRWFNACTQVIKDSHPDVIAVRTGKLFDICRAYCRAPFYAQLHGLRA